MFCANERAESNRIVLLPWSLCDNWHLKISASVTCYQISLFVFLLFERHVHSKKLNFGVGVAGSACHGLYFLIETICRVQTKGHIKLVRSSCFHFTY